VSENPILPGVEIVSGSPDETEVAALVAVSLAQAAALATPPAPATPEWVRRARTGGVTVGDQRIPGTRANDWRWSLHP